MALEEDAVEAPSKADVEAEQYLLFYLHDEVFAIEISQVTEIIPFGGLTQVPLMPAMVRGIINLRGSVVPVIDLHVRFGGSSLAVDKKTCIVILNAHSSGQLFQLGLMVDAVLQVMDIATDQLDAPPSFGGMISPEFVRGMARIDSKFVVVLNPAKAFNLDQLTDLVSQECY